MTDGQSNLIQTDVFVMLHPSPVLGTRLQNQAQGTFPSTLIPPCPVLVSLLLLTSRRDNGDRLIAVEPKMQPPPSPPPYQSISPLPSPDKTSMSAIQPSPRSAEATSSFPSPMAPPPMVNVLESRTKLKPVSVEPKVADAKVPEGELTKSERETIWSKRIQCVLYFIRQISLL